MLKNTSRSPLGWVILFILVVALAYGVFLWSEEAGAPGESSGEVNIGVVEVVESGIDMVEEGNKVVIKNEEIGYKFEVDDDLIANLHEGKVSLIEKDWPTDELYLGLLISFEEIEQDTIEKYLLSQPEGVYLRDPGVKKEVQQSFIAGGVEVEVMSFDFSNSYWPSEGGIIVLYHFLIENIYGLVTFSPAAPDVVNGTSRRVYEIIEQIIKTTS